MTNTTYALVVNKQIALYPLTIQDINERDNPAENYVTCYYDTEPEYDPLTEQLAHTPKLIGEHVFVMYRIVDKDLDAIISQLNDFITGELTNGRTPTINSLPNGMLGSIIQLTLKRVQQSLDNFAKTRGYDDIRSLCTYSTSTNLKFRDEGERGIFLRDQTWDSLYTFLGTVGAGGIPYPFTWDSIQSNLPALTWE
jgi:hypothetical protein